MNLQKSMSRWSATCMHPICLFSKGHQIKQKHYERSENGRRPLHLTLRMLMEGAKLDLAVGINNRFPKAIGIPISTT